MWFPVNDELLLDMLVINFLPSWWHRGYGVEFGARYAFDANYRIMVDRYMQYAVAKCYPDLHIGSYSPASRVVPPDFGNAVTPAAAGCDVEYPIDNYPWNRHLSWDRIRTLSVAPDPRQVFPYSEIISQVSYLNEKLGCDAAPWLPTRGVLNDAVLIGGMSLLEGLAEDASLAERLLDYAFQTLARNAEINYEDLGYRGNVMLTNCTVPMVGPRLYRDRLLSYDARIRDLTFALSGDLAIHHCGILDTYSSIYQSLSPIGFLEIGWDSDVRLALASFPEAVVQYIFSAGYVATATDIEIKAKMGELFDAAAGHLHRFRISVPDIEYGTPDDNLLTIHECCKRGAQ